ncbi:hypothetical protein [Saccharopolyspora phatthalungensis]|uniref:Uncharacterized protein n=1 Tax=Saccharopolyspora phatthalungensis TaxID=664693 RepID=A0A840QEX6_9PSEU|nr:hypothetical protein [Saccharopolyspora phatthalungensis]MBB5157139.1 hypothetical protein [Saccharopolyspora phatthalungensis]
MLTKLYPMTHTVVRSSHVELSELEESALDELADLVLAHHGAAIPVVTSRPVRGSTHHEVRESLKAMAEDDSLGFIPPDWEITFVARADEHVAGVVKLHGQRDYCGPDLDIEVMPWFPPHHRNTGTVAVNAMAAMIFEHLAPMLTPIHVRTVMARDHAQITADQVRATESVRLSGVDELASMIPCDDEGHL